MTDADSLMQEMLFEDPTQGSGASTADLPTLMKLSREKIGVQQEIERVEAQLKDLKKREESLNMDIVEAMGDAKKLELRDGWTIELEHVVSVRDTPEFREWLEGEGYGDLIKFEVIERFDRNEYEKARALMHALEELGYDNVESRESIHNSTLRAQIKRFLEAGKTFPGDLCKFHEFYRPKLKGPK